MREPQEEVFGTPLLVQIMARMREKDMSMADMSEIILGKRTEAGRKQMERLLAEYRNRYPAAFQRENTKKGRKSRKKKFVHVQNNPKEEANQ